MSSEKLVKTIESIGENFNRFKEANNQTWDQLTERVEAIEANSDHPAIITRSKPKHDFGRVLQKVADPRATIDGYEAEWSQEYVRRSGLDLPGAVWVPLTTKAVDYDSESPTSGGSNLVAQDLRENEFIDILRQQSVIMGLRPRMIDAVGDLDIPKETTGSTAYWISGDGGTITESESVFTTVQMRPKFCAGLVKYNYKVGLQTGGNVERIIRADLAAQIAAEIDNQAINGDGTSNKPTGILNQSGINSWTYPSSPKALTWTDAVELEKMLIDDKVPLTNCHYLAGATAYKLSKTVSRAGTEAIFLADFATQAEGPSLNGYPLHVSTHVPTNQLIFGNFDELLVATWGAVAIMSDPYTNFNTGTVGVRAIAPIDIAIRHAVSFAVAS